MPCIAPATAAAVAASSPVSSAIRQQDTGKRRAEREALLATLGEKVAALSSSTEWIAYLRFNAAFSRYSTGRREIFELPEWLVS